MAAKRQKLRAGRPRPVTWGIAIGLTFGLLIALAIGILWIGLAVGAVIGLGIGISLLLNLRRLDGKRLKSGRSGGGKGRR